MVTPAEALQYLFPTARPNVDWQLGDTGAGPRLVVWRLPGSPPTAAQIAAVTAEQVAAGRAVRQIGEAIALMGGWEAISRAVRGSDTVGYQLRNDAAEVLGVVIDHIDELAALPRAGRMSAIVGWIAADRAAWVADGGVFAQEPPDPQTTFELGTDRVQKDELLPLVGGAIAAGA